jgi:hypothetical protein
MSYRARIYLATVMLGGLALIVRALLDPVPPASLWFTCAILGVLATVAQLFKAEGPGNEGPGTFAFFATPVFLFAGVLLLPPPLLVLLVIIPHLVEWGKAHWDGGAHLQAWYIQPFNIAMYILAGSVAQWVYLTQQPTSPRRSARLGTRSLVARIRRVTAQKSVARMDHALLGVIRRIALDS